MGVYIIYDVSIEKEHILLYHLRDVNTKISQHFVDDEKLCY